MDDIIDPGSATWRRVHTFVQGRLNTLRLRLESPGMKEVETNVTRGRIDELKLLLGLVEPRPDIPADNTDNTAGY